MKKKSMTLLLAVLLIPVLSACSRQNGTEKVQEPAPELTETSSDEGTEVSAPDADHKTAEDSSEVQPDQAGEKEQPLLVQITEDDPSIAYVLVRMQNSMGLLPLPTEGEYKRTIRQTMEDGTEAINVVHLTPNGVRMEDSNCPGHDCINEGEVTLENREVRVLWNMIICLPHELSLELITREEAEQMIR